MCNGSGAAGAASTGTVEGQRAAADKLLENYSKTLDEIRGRQQTLNVQRATWDTRRYNASSDTAQVRAVKQVNEIDKKLNGIAKEVDRAAVKHNADLNRIYGV